MFFFPFIEKLYSPEKMLVYVSLRYDDYLHQNPEEYEIYARAESAYTITLENWMDNIKVRKPFIHNAFSDYPEHNIPFKQYIVECMFYGLSKDWRTGFLSNAIKENEKETLFFQEHEYVVQVITHKEHFAPVRDKLLKKMADIKLDYKLFKIEPRTMADNSKLNQQSPLGRVPTLMWQGGAARLATLFHELRTTKRGNGKVDLDYTPTQLQEFIMAVFKDEQGNDFSKETLKTYLDPKRPDKKAKKDPIVIPPDGIK